MEREEARRLIEEYREKIAYHSRLYYEEDAPKISDFEYDAMFRALQDLEAEFPEFDSPASPTKKKTSRLTCLFSLCIRYQREIYFV